MRTLKTLSPVLVAVGVVAFLAGTYHVAYAQALDPASDPIGTASTVYSLWKSGALLPAIIVAAFGVAIGLSRLVPSLREGRRAVYTAGVIAALAIVAEPASRGTTPNVGMLVAAIGAFVALVFPPVKPEAK